MQVAIIQPNFVPWLGYFDMIDSVDLFILHDDTQYTKQDWRNRNAIKTKEGRRWITVPVNYKSTTQQIMQTEIAERPRWIRGHLALLKEHYSRATHFEDVFGDYSRILKTDFGLLAELDIALIEWAMALLRIQTPLIRSSSLRVRGRRADKVHGLLAEVGATRYLSGPSAASYLDPRRFAREGIGLSYKGYAYPEYQQLWGRFIPGLSVLDALFNLGIDARGVMKSGIPDVDVVPVA